MISLITGKKTRLNRFLRSPSNPLTHYRDNLQTELFGPALETTPALCMSTACQTPPRTSTTLKPRTQRLQYSLSKIQNRWNYYQIIINGCARRPLACHHRHLASIRPNASSRFNAIVLYQSDKNWMGLCRLTSPKAAYHSTKSSSSAFMPSPIFFPPRSVYFILDHAKLGIKWKTNWKMQIAKENLARNK